MHVLVKVAENENLIIIAYWLTLEEFFGLLQSSLVLLNFISFCIKYETIGYPAVVTAENKDL
jgi:hypothetical protein